MQINLRDAKKFVNKRFIVDKSLKNGGSIFLAYLRDQPSSKVIIKFVEENKNNVKKEKSNSEPIIQSKLKHTSICELYEYEKVNKYYYLVLEYLKYGDIENFKRNIVQRSLFSESFLCFLAYSLLNSLKYLHIQNKIIHMNIKPQNILINEKLIIKLTDFSISLDYKDKSKEDIIVLPSEGTCYFISPETSNKNISNIDLASEETNYFTSPEIINKNKRKIKAKDASKIDIYSLGVTLYFLAFCDYPNILRDKLEFSEGNGYSEGFRKFLKRMIDEDINVRYNVIGALNDPWVKGGEIILDEKEKLFNDEKFLCELLVNEIKEFNDYVGSLEFN